MLRPATRPPASEVTPPALLRNRVFSQVVGPVGECRSNRGLPESFATKKIREASKPGESLAKPVKQSPFDAFDSEPMSSPVATKGDDVATLAVKVSLPKLRDFAGEGDEIRQ